MRTGPTLKFGQIVGFDHSGGVNYAFWWDNGSFTHINFELAYGVNDPTTTAMNSFQMVGPGPLQSGNHVDGYLYDVASGAYSFIDFPGANDSVGLGVIDDVQIVGLYDSGQTPKYAFLDDAGTFSSINNSAPGTVANGINGFGQIVGYLTVPGEPATVLSMRTVRSRSRSTARELLTPKQPRSTITSWSSAVASYEAYLKPSFTISIRRK